MFDSQPPTSPCAHACRQRTGGIVASVFQTLQAVEQRVNDELAVPRDTVIQVCEDTTHGGGCGGRAGCGLAVRSEGFAGAAAV